MRYALSESCSLWTQMSNYGDNRVRPKTILLVEDEAIIRLAEARMLRGEGYEVVTASTGKKR